jgi:hypothetical protein
MRLDRFTHAYLEAMLWSSSDESDEPLDRNYSVDDVADEAVLQAVEDCERFQAECEDALDSAGESSTKAGHDFWLTRCGHGAGRASGYRLIEKSGAWFEEEERGAA